jgi:hypothetical protein
MTEAETRAYYEGLREGITRYAVWRDGRQEVGCLGDPLASVLARINLEESDALASIQSV